MPKTINLASISHKSEDILAETTPFKGDLKVVNYMQND
jgi:hypothetical protein